MATVFVEKEDADVVRLKNTSGGAVVTDQLVVIGGLVAVATENVASNAGGAIDVAQRRVVQASNLHASLNTFSRGGPLV